MSLVQTLERRWRRMERLGALSDSEQQRLLRTLGLILFFRVGLWVAPLRGLRRAVDLLSEQSAVERGRPSAARIGREVSRLAAFVPAASCLTQALAAEVMLRRYGYEPQNKLGVARGASGEFRAHAWIVCDEQIVVGDLGPGMVFTTLQPASSGDAAG